MTENTGNAITQSFMTIPALLLEFPSPTSPEYANRAAYLGRQWPICWTAGNVFFRPISTLGALGYGFSTYRAYTAAISKADWRLFAIAFFMHVVIILHSAINMQPLNDKVAALNPGSTTMTDKAFKSNQVQAENMLKKWAKWNYVRIAAPFIAGTVALWNSLA